MRCFQSGLDQCRVQQGVACPPNEMACGVVVVGVQRNDAGKTVNAHLPFQIINFRLVGTAPKMPGQVLPPRVLPGGGLETGRVANGIGVNMAALGGGWVVVQVLEECRDGLSSFRLIAVDGRRRLLAP